MTSKLDLDDRTLHYLIFGLGVGFWHLCNQFFPVFLAEWFQKVVSSMVGSLWRKKSKKKRK